MLTKKVIKFILVYLIVANSVTALVYLAEYIYLKKTPSVKTYRSFVLNAIEKDQRRFNNYKVTDDYAKLMNATTVDSIRFYYEKFKYSHAE